MKALILILILTGLGVATVWAISRLFHTSGEFAPDRVKDVNYDPRTHILTFRGGETGELYKFRGNCTVWHTMSGKRLDTLMESALADIWEYWRYNVKEKSDDRLGTSKD